MKQVTIVTGLAYGDEGKGTTVDALARRLPSPPVVVRHNGGPQAAHNVVLPDGKEHTFSQWGSGTFAGARTHLSKHCLINPVNMVPEAMHLVSQGVSAPFEGITVAESARIITPYHMAVGRAREWARGGGRHGSCGQGIGELMLDWHTDHGLRQMVLKAEDLLLPLDKFIGLLVFWRNEKRKHLDDLGLSFEQADELFADEMLEPLAVEMLGVGKELTIVHNEYEQELLDNGENLIFEGAQGVLLDECYGFHPHTTWSDTTTNNAFDLIGDFDLDKVLSLGVTRTYGTRHGAGPFVTESSLWNPPEPHNGTGDWQGDFRTGWFDVLALRYALEVAGPIDALVVTHLDTIQDCETVPICTAYTFNGFQTFTSPLIKINPHQPHEDEFLVWQEKLTKEIMLAEPVYETRMTKDFCGSDWMSQKPIYMKSCGPTFQEKVFLGA